MRSRNLIVVALAILIPTAAIEAQVGSTRYELNGSNYAVPPKYDFMRNSFSTRLKEVEGLDKEPADSVWLQFPAGELSRDIPGYSRTFHGYSDDVEADMRVNVVGGVEAQEFPEDRTATLGKVAEFLKEGKPVETDEATGWERVYWVRSQKGMKGRSLFYLMPKEGLEKMPADWLSPSCQGSADVNGRETYDCQFVIHRNGFTFLFSLRQENLGLANRVPDYVLLRLEGWKS